jgi:hypothetical protein
MDLLMMLFNWACDTHVVVYDSSGNIYSDPYASSKEQAERVPSVLDLE